MKEIKWIKLDTNLFDNRKIKQIESMPDGDALVVIWLKLLILAGIVNDGGCVYFTKDIPFTDQLLATEFNRPLATVQLALATFQKFGMIEIVDDMILVSNWEKYQSVDKLDLIREKTRIRVSNYRARQKLLSGNVTSNVTVTESNAVEEDKEEDKDIDIKKERKRDKKSYEVVIENFTDDPDLISAIKEFLKMRQLAKKPMTDRALSLMLNKLFGLSKDTETQIKILEQSIERNWLSVFELKDKGFSGQPKYKKYNSALDYKQTPINEKDFNNMVVDLNDLDKARKAKNLMEHERKWNPSTERDEIPEEDIKAMIVDLGGNENDER